jgi:hypothetical protein
MTMALVLTFVLSNSKIKKKNNQDNQNRIAAAQRKIQTFFSFTIKIYPYLIAIPAFDLATECIYNIENSAYIAIGALNLIFALIFSFV